MARLQPLPIFVSLLVGIGLGWLMFHPIPPDTRVPGAAVQPPAAPSAPDVATATTATAATPAPPAPAPPTAEPGAHNLDGFGKAALALDLVQGSAALRMTYSGEGNFVVRLLDAKGEKVGGSVANEIGAWSGTKDVKIPSTGKYVVDVDASGPWTIIVTDARGAR